MVLPISSTIPCPARVDHLLYIRKLYTVAAVDHRVKLISSVLPLEHTRTIGNCIERRRVNTDPFTGN